MQNPIPGAWYSEAPENKLLMSFYQRAPIHTFINTKNKIIDVIRTI